MCPERCIYIFIVIIITMLQWTHDLGDDVSGLILISRPPAVMLRPWQPPEPLVISISQAVIYSIQICNSLSLTLAGRSVSVTVLIAVWRDEILGRDKKMDR